MAWYSAVRGTSCNRPGGLVGSNRPAPALPSARCHWPFRLGYFASSNACAAVAVSSATMSAAAPIELRKSMWVLPAFLWPATRAQRREGVFQQHQKRPAIAEAMPAGGTTPTRRGSEIPAHLVPRGGCAQSYTTAPVTGRPARARPRSRLAPEHVPLKFTHCRVELPTLPHPRGTEKSRLIPDGCVHGRVSYRRKSCRAGHKEFVTLCRLQ